MTKKLKKSLLKQKIRQNKIKQKIIDKIGRYKLNTNKNNKIYLKNKKLCKKNKGYNKNNNKMQNNNKINSTIKDHNLLSSNRTSYRWRYKKHCNN